MRIRTVRFYTLTLISLLSLAVFAARARAQAHPSNRLSGSPMLGAKRKPHKAKIAAGSGFSTLYSFCTQPNCTDGSTSPAGLISDGAGNLYGTTSQGGANTGANGGVGGGTVFMVDSTGQESVLYSFCSAVNCTDGYYPLAGLIQDAAGNLYGTTTYGGSGKGGTVFKLEPPGQQGGTWTEVVLYNFCPVKGCTDGKNPQAGLLQDTVGNLYGTTANGGTHGWGAVFEVNSSGVETVLYSFKQPSSADGNTPVAGLIQDAAGDLYGTTSQGGANNAGTVFKLTKAGVETVLYSFCPAGVGGCTDGQSPQAGLIADAAGNLYSTTNSGGAYGYGAVFEVSPAGAETVLYSFCSAGGNCIDGAYPLAGLLQDAAGNLYGTTDSGGTGSLGCLVNSLNSCGTAFRLAPPAQQGGAWTETVLYSFCSAGGTNCTDGADPQAGLIQDSAGNLYSTTWAGGAAAAGTVFKVASGAQLTPSVTLTSAPNPSFVDQSVTLSVVVSGSGPTPTGSVTFQEGQTTLGTVTLANGQASLGTTFTAAGSFSITASYSGDPNYKAGNSSPITQVVNQYTTSTALASSPNPSNYGQAVTFTATVTSAGPTPTGTVTFLNAGTSFGSASLSGGVAILTTSALPVGSLAITASYGGDAANATSTSLPLTQVVNLDTTSTALASSPNPSNYGQAVTFTATVTSAGPTPTGTVTFLNAGTSFGSASLSGGVATLTTSALPVGSLTITASYAGDAGHAASTSAPLTQVVNKDTTSTALTSSLNPSIYGQAVTFTATVSSAGPTPTGTVTFFNGKKTLGSASLSGGVAQFTTSTLTVGTLTITAVYAGDAGHTGSKSPALKQVVNKATSATTVASSLNPSKVGLKVTFTATVTSPTTAPTGTVKFMDGSTVLGTGTLAKATGKAKYSTSTLSAGSHNITAVYAGTADITGSTSPVLVQVVN